MKTLIKFLAFLFFIAISSCNKGNEEPDMVVTSLFTSTEDIYDSYTNEVLGQSTLRRFEDKITGTFETSNLIPGHVYNLIWAIYNKPENCQDSPSCGPGDFINLNTATQAVAFVAKGIEATGTTANLSAVLYKGDITRNITDMRSFGSPTLGWGGLQDVLTAEVHLVLRSHGPAIPEQLNEQLTLIDGGCTLIWGILDPNARVPTEVGECAKIQEVRHLPPG